MVDEEGYEMSAVVIGVSNGAVTVDANAPLAGKTVIYDIELLEIVEKKKPA